METIQPRITVVGSINMDLVFRTPRMPLTGETITGSGFQQVPGGKGANQAVAAARQGALVSFVGAVGEDSFGQHALACLVREGVELGHVSKGSGAATGVAGIFVDAHGANNIVLAPGANDSLSLTQVNGAARTIADADFLICQLESPLESVRRAIAIAKENAVQVVFNPAPAQQLDDGLLAGVDYLIVNETEATQLSGIDVTDTDSASRAAQALRRRGAHEVLLTMGGQGVLVAGRSGERLIPAFKVPVVDTTAAGDTFVGVFTVAMGRGLSIDDAVTEAQCAAALAVTRMGAQTSIPTRAELLATMHSTERRGVP